MTCKLTSLLVLTYIYCKTGCGSEKPTLTPTEVDEWTGQNITLSCSRRNEALDIILWLLSLNEISLQGVMGKQGSDCVSGGFFLNSATYSVECIDDYTFNMTIRNITQKQHNVNVSCVALSLESNWVNIKVKIPVKTVTLTPATLTLNETDTIALHCTTSKCRPQPLFYWFINEDNTPERSLNSSTQSIGSSIEPFNSTFNDIANRSMDGWCITCGASNQISYNSTVVKSTKDACLDIKYPPDGYPQIDGFTNNSTYYVADGSKVSLNCSVGKSKPAAELSWKLQPSILLTNTTTSNSSIGISWIAERRKGTTCACLSDHILQTSVKEVTLKIDVLYPANITQLKLNGEVVQSDTKEIKMMENSTVSIKWETEGNPPPTVKWTRSSQNGTGDEAMGQNTTIEIRNISRSQNGTLCQFTAVNNMIDSAGRNELTTVRMNLILIVLYPPDVKMLSNITIIEGHGMDVTCLTGGNVNDLSVKWTNQAENRTTLNLQRINRSDSGWFICEVKYSMTSSTADFKNGTIEQKFYLDVLYPSEGITINSTQDPNHPFDDKIRIIQSDVVELYCYATGKPIPREYKWSGISSSRSSVIVLKGNKDNVGNITCHAYNNMAEMPDNKTVRGAGNRTFIVDVLHPPKIIDFRFVNATEGTYFSLGCMSDVGKVSTLEMCWYKGNETVSCNEPLVVTNVTNENAGVYHCTVNFSMVPTFGEEVSTSIQTGIMLQVNAKGVGQAVVSEAPSIAAAVGGTLAGIVVVALVAVVLVYFILKRKQPPKLTEEMNHYQNVSSAHNGNYFLTGTRLHIKVVKRPRSWLLQIYMMTSNQASRRFQIMNI